MTDGLLEAAQAERGRRADDYGRRIPAGEIADVQGATIDYQCWVAIAEWIETGRFKGFHGGAEPERDDAPWISWPELEATAEKALAMATAKCDRILAGGDGEGESYAEACLRRARLNCIHRKVQLRRQLVDSINRDLLAKREPVEIAA